MGAEVVAKPLLVPKLVASPAMLVPGLEDDDRQACASHRGSRRESRYAGANYLNRCSRNNKNWPQWRTKRG
jgi:hypothetical protein